MMRPNIRSIVVVTGFLFIGALLPWLANVTPSSLLPSELVQTPTAYALAQNQLAPETPSQLV